MPIDAPCPDAAFFEQLVQGKLTADQIEPLARHLEACDGCVQTVRAMRGEGTLIALLRGRKLARDQEPQSSWVIAPEFYDFLGPAQGPNEIGRLGPYRVLRVLGVGGMGIVFQAEDRKLKRPVALKAMKPALATSPSARKRFLREAQATAAIEHDHIVTIYQVGEDRHVPFIAMQLLQGETLEDRLQRIESARRAASADPPGARGQKSDTGLMPLADVLRIGREIAAGLAVAHDRGLMHRDIKPANIYLVNDDGSRRAALGPSHSRVKILDFGLARGAGSDGAHLTQQGAIIGTPAYMAPEQANSQAIDSRCDLFSLGCVLYRMTSGELPFQGFTPLDTLLAVIERTPTPPRQLNPGIPEGVERLVMTLLEKDPAKRLQSAQKVIEVVVALEQKFAEGPMTPAAPSAKMTRPAGADQRSKARSTAPVALADGAPHVGQPATSPGPTPLRLSPAIARRLALIVGVLLIVGAAYSVFELALQTPLGRVTVLVEGDDIETRFKNGRIELYSDDGELKYSLEPTESARDVSRGKYVVQVAGADATQLKITGSDGVEIEADNFEVKRGGQITVRVVLQPVKGPLAGNVQAAETPKTDYDAFATGQWVSVLPSTEEFNRLRPQNVPKGREPRFDRGILECKGWMFFPDHKAKDCIIRARVKKLGPRNTSNVALNLRHADGSWVAAWFNGGGSFGIGKQDPRTRNWRDFTTCRLSGNYDDFFEFAFAAIGDRLTAYANGRRILDVRNPRLDIGRGTPAVGGVGLFRDIEVQVFD